MSYCATLLDLKPITRAIRYMLRICVLTPAFPPEIGGQEIHLHELSESLLSLGASAFVLTRRLEMSYPAADVVGSVAVRRLTPSGESKGRGWQAIGPLGVFLIKVIYQLVKNRRQYDVVLVSGFNVLPLAAAIASRITGKPCLVRPESPMELRDPVGVESRKKMGLSEKSAAIRLIGIGRAWTTRRMDRFVAISSEIRRGLLSAGVEAARIVDIPNGIDVKKFAPVDAARRAQLRQALGLPADGLLVAYTGRLAFSKGVMMLAEIWRRLAGEFPQAHLVLVGTGFGSIDSCEDEVRRAAAEPALHGRITLAGNVGNAQEYLQCADVFAFPSDYEGFGLSLLEAMAVGLPMVSTRVGVVADLAAELAAEPPPALLVAPHDAAAFETHLRELLADPGLRRTLGQRARLAVGARFSMRAVAQAHLTVMEDITGARLVNQE
jgi:glycosyltransferase involved in cell wall biosynthesis